MAIQEQRRKGEAQQKGALDYAKFALKYANYSRIQTTLLNFPFTLLY